MVLDNFSLNNFEDPQDIYQFNHEILLLKDSGLYKKDKLEKFRVVENM